MANKCVDLKGNEIRLVANSDLAQNHQKKRPALRGGAKNKKIPSSVPG
jgi:hypothetical protein